MLSILLVIFVDSQMNKSLNLTRLVRILASLDTGFKKLITLNFKTKLLEGCNGHRITFTPKVEKFSAKQSV